MTEVIEPGITRTSPAERKHWHAAASDVITYNTREMTPEQLARHGLERYIEAVTSDKRSKS